MKKYIQISIRTKSETKDWCIGSEFLSSLDVGKGFLTPEQVSHNPDKFKENFIDNLACKSIWASKALIEYGDVKADFYLDFSWRRKQSVKSNGVVSHGKVNQKGQVVPSTINFRSDYSKAVDFYSLFRDWCLIFPPQIGMLHVFTEQEVSAHEDDLAFKIGSFKALLDPKIPNMAWAMFFGGEFLTEFDPILVARSGFAIEKLEGGYLVRVTENIEDVVNNFLFFSERRAAFKKLFRADFFLMDG